MPIGEVKVYRMVCDECGATSGNVAAISIGDSMYRCQKQEWNEASPQKTWRFCRQDGYGEWMAFCPKCMAVPKSRKSCGR